MRLRLAAPLLALALLPPACGGGEKPGEPLPEAPSSIKLESAAFDDGGTIPERFTCSGEGVSPPLTWSGVPDATKELALLVEDPDADRFPHWTVLAIDAGTTEVAAGEVPRGAIETENGFGDRGWGGPCPPEGDAPHRYVFTLYALDAQLRLDADASADEVRRALGGHALARGTLTGRFGR
jgi:Raf kinase inhibitor-like YbhB/YbcL family protein